MTNETYQVGDRVFFIEARPNKWPVGVVTRIQEDLIHIEVTWDNGVVASHNADQIENVDKIIALIGKLIPKD